MSGTFNYPDILISIFIQQIRNQSLVNIRALVNKVFRQVHFKMVGENQHELVNLVRECVRSEIEPRSSG